MQTYADDDVIIRRQKRKRQSKKTSGNSSDSKKRGKNSSNDDVDFKLQKQIRIISVLLLLLAIILLLSMVSYNPRDEVNTEISFSEFFKLLAGDLAVRAKFESVYNLLGIFGAVAANFMFNYLLGYITIILPFFMVLWAKDLFLNFSVSRDLARRTILYLIFALLFSSFIGTLQHISWFSEISREWSGSIGQFISAIITGFIGNFGTILLIIAGAAITFIFGTNVNINNLLERLNLSERKPFKFIIELKAKTMEKLQMSFKQDKSIATDDDDIYEPDADSLVPPSEVKINRREFLPNEDTEPAQIIKRNLNIQNRSLDSSQILRKKADDPLKISRDPDTFENVPDDSIIDPPDSINPPEESIHTANDMDSINAENPIIDPEDNLNKKPLTVTVKESNPEEENEPVNPLGTSIHDEEIDYLPPSLDLLTAQDDLPDVNDTELSENAKILREKLETFKIEIDNLSVTPGPVVTQYEFVPAPGIKVSRIESLSDDIAMALKARGIRIIAPIPGKGTIGIEIPNKNPSIVRASSIIKSARFNQSEHKLPLALGKTIGGDVYCVDLTKLPHLLIAGSTGSGKSVGINTILASLLYRKHPSELKFVIIDPKKVELNQYSLLEKHFLASSPDFEDLIITSPEEAVIVLKAVCAEMDHRYDILAQVGQRNILDYNNKVKAGKYNDDKELLHRPMPYIVVVIDELADLMMTAAKEVEAPIIRIAQLARAVGIHLVVATQRPSVDVITGIIKANFPARMAYLVASKIDSRTILDQSGADQLLGNGDMLFLPGGSPKPIRIQNSFISTDEVEDICRHIGNQKGYSQPYMLPSLIEDTKGGWGISKEDRDSLFEEAARMVIALQQASVSIVQRRLKVGYARAGKIIDELEDAGIVGPYAGSKARDVMMESEIELEAVL
ncbi:DNA translocase FtsK 4TM domain-containing protein [Bacteroidota bacterium]